MATEVPKSPWNICPLLPGMEIPALTLIQEDFTPLNLKEAARQKPAVFVFFRGGW